MVIRLENQVVLGIDRLITYRSFDHVSIEARSRGSYTRNQGPWATRPPRPVYARERASSPGASTVASLLASMVLGARSLDARHLGPSTACRAEEPAECLVSDASGLKIPGLGGSGNGLGEGLQKGRAGVGRKWARSGAARLRGPRLVACRVSEA
jgi:hypothetical protein